VREIFPHMVLESLDELASLEYQRRTWVEGGPDDYSSFEECVSTLFDDSGLIFALAGRDEVFNPQIDSSLRAFNKSLKVIDARRSPEDVVGDPAFERIRVAALEIAQAIRAKAQREEGPNPRPKSIAPPEGPAAAAGPHRPAPTTTETIRVHMNMVMEALDELGDTAYQRRVWVDGDPDEVSSFTGSVRRLFDDSGLRYALDRKKSVLGPAIDSYLLQLGSTASRFDDHRPPAEVAADPAMEEIRALARKITQMIKEEFPAQTRPPTTNA
jgi:hypothetical protein